MFQIDSQLPSTTGRVNTVAGVTLTYSVTDLTPGSGVAGFASCRGRASNLPTAASGTVPLAGTCSAVEFWGEDVAGNTSTPHLSPCRLGTAGLHDGASGDHDHHLCTTAAGLNLGTAAATDDCGRSR